MTCWQNLSITDYAFKETAANTSSHTIGGAGPDPVGQED